MDGKKIIERMDTIVSLLIPAFDATNYSVKGLKLDILRLCDYEHTVQDIVKKLKKSKSQIENELSNLRALDLIKSLVKDKKTVYARLK
jgi:DNA-binding transcriptional ArsR family regulator